MTDKQTISELLKIIDGTNPKIRADRYANGYFTRSIKKLIHKIQKNTTNGTTRKSTNKNQTRRH